MTNLSESKIETKDYATIAAAKRANLKSLIPQEWRLEPPLASTDDVSDVTRHALKYLTTRETDITEKYTAGQLVERIARGDYSALEVAKAFGRRAVVAGQLTNCLSEILLPEAFERAVELDAHLADTGTTVGPLHGLPVSLKDQFRVEGTETSMGFVGLLGKKETKESESQVVTALREAGAVLFVKTNVPSGMMAVETNNNIVGYTSNAYNRNLSSGGSSGGEASLIASRGSLIGLGTDIGASIRLPAGVNGLYGLKPSVGRLSYKGVANTMEGQSIVPSVVGPISHSPSDLSLMMKTLLGSNPWNRDPNVIPLPWRPHVTEKVSSQVADRKLKFGVMRWDGVVMPHPPIQRVLEETVSKLRSTGFEVIDWDPPSHSEAFDILFRTFTSDSGQSIHSLLSLTSEPPVPELALSYSISASAALSALGPPMTLDAYWDLQKQCTSFRERYFEYWNTVTASTTTAAATASTTTTGVDAVIMPVAPSASVKKGEGKYFGYTGVGNVLDASVITVPAGTVDKVRDGKKERDMEGVGDMDREIWESYDPKTFDGMPVGLQIMCRRLEEEKVLAIATHLEGLIFRK